MGGSSKQVSGYKYFANFLLFIGNPIEKLLGINFDKRGWQTGERVPYGSNGEQITIDAPNLYGENEGGVSGLVYLKTGTDTQTPVEFYQDYLESVSLPALAYPFQSYLAFKDFYLGNSGYPKEMLLWPQRTRIRNDGTDQWYKVREDGAVVCEIGLYSIIQSGGEQVQNIPDFTYSLMGIAGEYTYTESTGLFNQYSSDGYGGAENPSISNAIYFSPIAEELALFDLVEIHAEISGSVREVEYSLKDASAIYDFSVEWTGDENEEKNITIYVVCKKGANFPYLEIIGTGTIGGSPSSQYYYWTYNSTTKPLDSFSYFDQSNGIDINPIHKVREILTDDTAMNKPESAVNDINFMKAADRIYEEGLGISWAITEKSCIDAINEICSHIEAGVRVNRQTGLYEIVLFRDDWFEESEIHSLAENKIKTMQIDPINVEDVKNYLNVSHYDRANIKDASFSIAENASIKNMSGFVNAETADFPYFMNQRNAAVVAQWKLKQFTTPCWKGTFTTGYNEARKWNRYDIVKINWSRKNIVDLPVRIMSINLGDGVDNTVSINFVEVVPFSEELTSTVVIDDKIDTAPLPPQACQYEPFEMPYYLAVMALGQRKVDEELAYENDFGLVGVVAERPQNNSLYAVMMTHDGTVGEEWNRAASIHYDETADLDQIISKITSSFTVKNWKKIANVSVGTLVKCGRDWLGTPGEWMVFQGVDPYTGVVSVKRGALDTPPQEWGVDTKLYFCGNDVAYDSTDYLSGEEILVSALTTTPSGILEQGGSIAIEIQSRAIRPYPPANVKINGEYFPAEIETDLILTWVDRNRVQQTGGSILGWYEGGVTLEDGVTYVLELHNLDTSTDVLSANVGAVNNYSFTGLITSDYRLRLYSVRESYVSLQMFEHIFHLRTNDKLTQEDGTSNLLLESGDFILMEQ